MTQDPTQTKDPVVHVAKEPGEQVKTESGASRSEEKPGGWGGLKAQASSPATTPATDTTPSSSAPEKPSFLDRVGSLFGNKKEENAPAPAATDSPAAVAVQPAEASAEPAKAEAEGTVKIEDKPAKEKPARETRRHGDKKAAPGAGEGGTATQ